MAKQKTAIITGGATGLGLAASRKFVVGGIKTIIVGRNEHNLAAVAKELGPLCHYKV
jgi:short-subunit dehydrogenase involved in D-alanine esterification of teichoic acids